MLTTTIEANCTARPSRLAFVLPTPDRATLPSVIGTATSLWGGIFNPIVILDGSTKIVHGVQEPPLSQDEHLKSQVSVEPIH
jgi:hypothetical protein